MIVNCIIIIAWLQNYLSFFSTTEPLDCVYYFISLNYIYILTCPRVNFLS